MTEVRVVNHIKVTSGTFEIPTQSDGSLSLAALRAQLPGASGLWFWSDEDPSIKKAIRYDPDRNKLLPPNENGWGERVYNVSYSTSLQYGPQNEHGYLERYEIASRMLQQSIESLARLNASPLVVPEDKPQAIVKVAYQSKRSISSESEKRKSSVSLNSDFNEENLKSENRQFEENAKIVELQKWQKQTEGILNNKNLEIDDLKSKLEKMKLDFELMSSPSEGFGDSHAVREIASLKRELDDAKWKCGEMESGLKAKSRECSTLHDWKRETENAMNKLQTEHGGCNNRREKLEATIHALHQFALIMKHEADMAKKKAGFDIESRVYISDTEKSIIERDERITRLEKDLDVARDNLHRQTEEIDNYRWKCSELETILSIRDQELNLKCKEAQNREKTLLSDLETANLKFKLMKVQQHGSSDEDQDSDQDQDQTETNTEDGRQSFVEVSSNPIIECIIGDHSSLASFEMLQNDSEPTSEVL